MTYELREDIKELSDIIQDAWYTANLQQGNTFGDFYRLAANRITEAGYQKVGKFDFVVKKPEPTVILPEVEEYRE